jgi:hypothetical protein
MPNTADHVYLTKLDSPARQVFNFCMAVTLHEVHCWKALSLPSSFIVCTRMPEGTRGSKSRHDRFLCVLIELCGQLYLQQFTWLLKSHSLVDLIWPQYARGVVELHVFECHSDSDADM